MGEFILNGRNYGGSIITPNPSDTPTDSLDSIKIDNTTYEIQGGGGGGSNLILDAQRYSLEEQVVGIWTDGKPLYQKTLYSATTVIGASTNFFDLSALYIDEMVDWHGNFIRDGKNYSVDMVEKPSSSSANTYARCRYVPDTKQFAVNVADFSGYTTSFGRLYVTIQYTKTTDTAGSGGYQAYGFSPIIYSDVEREVGVWRDNKPLYQRTWQIALTMNAPNQWFSTGIGVTANHIDKVIGIVQAVSDGSTVWDNIGLATNADDVVRLISSRNTGGIQIEYITLQYTKITDVAGSGEYNTLAIPNVHYDNTEKVIGTWFGETLYQRSYYIGTLTVDTSWHPIAHGILNFKKLVDLSGCITNSSDGRMYNTPHYRPNNDKGISFSVDTTNIYYMNNWINGKDAYVTIQYTKTT